MQENKNAKEEPLHNGDFVNFQKANQSSRTKHLHGTDFHNILKGKKEVHLPVFLNLESCRETIPGCNAKLSLPACSALPEKREPSCDLRHWFKQTAGFSVSLGFVCSSGKRDRKSLCNWSQFTLILINKAAWQWSDAWWCPNKIMHMYAAFWRLVFDSGGFNSLGWKAGFLHMCTVVSSHTGINRRLMKPSAGEAAYIQNKDVSALWEWEYVTEKNVVASGIAGPSRPPASPYPHPPCWNLAVPR